MGVFRRSSAEEKREEWQTTVLFEV